MARARKFKVKRLSSAKPERYKFRDIMGYGNIRRRQRLGFKDSKVVEVAEFMEKKKNPGLL